MIFHQDNFKFNLAENYSFDIVETVTTISNGHSQSEFPSVQQLMEIIRNLEAQVSTLRNELASTRNELTKTRDDLDIARNEIAKLKEENRQLRDELAVYKGQKPKPKIPPSKLEGPNSDGKKDKIGMSRGKCPRKKKKNLVAIDQEQIIQPANVPAGARFKGYKYFTVQDIVFKTNNTLYKLARWQLEDGSYISGELPSGVFSHYGPEVITFILHQYYACRVTEPLLLAQLRERGVLISAGQLNNILIHHKDVFHEEVSQLLAAGVKAQNQIQVDDTGGRHKGKNQYTTVIGNEYFSVFTTSDSKSRANFFRMLQNKKHEYLINEDAIAYLEAFDSESYLPGYIATYKGRNISGEKAWKQFLKNLNIRQEGEIRCVTEAALIASVIAHGIPRDLGVHADDAKQFDAFIRSLCWIHEERHYRKIIPIDDKAREDLSRIRDQIWTIYKDLKEYKISPSREAKMRIEHLFETTFTQTTSSYTLNRQLKLTYSKKQDLLRVLDRPETPLHNNSSETDARSAVTKRKVSGGTRSDEGRDARDTFLSLKQTCLKLKINFIIYLRDRVSRLHNIPNLAVVIAQRMAPQ